MHRHFVPLETEPHHVHGIPRADFLGKLPSCSCGMPKWSLHGASAPLLSRPRDGNARPSERRSKVVIDVFVAVHIVNPAGLSVFHKNGVGLVVPVIARHAKRDALQRRLCAAADFGVRFS